MYERQSNRQAYGQTDILAYGQTDRRKDRQTDLPSAQRRVMLFTSCIHHLRTRFRANRYILFEKGVHERQTSRQKGGEIVTKLFPQNASTGNCRDRHHRSSYDKGQEVLEAAKKIAENKVPGLDSIPNKALKAAVQISPHMFGKAFIPCFKEGASPTQWKAETNTNFQDKQTSGSTFVL